ncbi:lysosomal acid phosphatase-like [Diabrotica undecimpunctata]|uniref:lysosomal acid phosphatase-like n=1 Tax=Diabrotica undecimpunctata TaxID=50387 RepID=UPI003B63B147
MTNSSNFKFSYLVLVCSFILVVATNDAKTNNSSELVAVAVIFRHGDRSPMASFPTDEYFKEFYWPMGFGQLTKKGIQRQYKLGQWLRQKYKGFLNELYFSKDIYVQSSNLDRCLMSASATLAGLYPPKDDQVWNDELPWQPVPVHVGLETYMRKQDCHKYVKLYAKTLKVYNKVFREKYLQFFEYISAHSGFEDVTISNVAAVRSSMYIYKNYNTSFIPEWLGKMDQKTLDFIAATKYTIPAATPTLTRLSVGVFYNYLFENLDKFIDPSIKDKPQKFMLMASHDTTISPILNGLGLYDMRPIGFSDAFIVELRKNNKGSYFINFLFKSGDKLEQRVLKECEFDCNYNAVKDLLKNVTIDVDRRRIECAERGKMIKEAFKGDQTLINYFN